MPCVHIRHINIGEIHYHIENKTNGGKQIEFSAESNQFEKKKKITVVVVVYLLTNIYI